MLNIAGRGAFNVYLYMILFSQWQSFQIYEIPCKCNSSLSIPVRMPLRVNIILVPTSSKRLNFYYVVEYYNKASNKVIYLVMTGCGGKDKSGYFSLKFLFCSELLKIFFEHSILKYLRLYIPGVIGVRHSVMCSNCGK